MKGKQVAFEEGSTSDILLRSAVDKAGLKWDDIHAIPMPAANAGGALIAGRVNIAVTYEPYISEAKAQSANVRTLYSGSDDPGLIGDVLVARDDTINAKPGQILAAVKSWGQAVDYYRANIDSGRKVISEAIGSTPQELETGFNGVRFVSQAENKAELNHTFISDVLPKIEKAALGSGLITHKVEPEQVIDARFVEAIE